MYWFFNDLRFKFKFNLFESVWQYFDKRNSMIITDMLYI